MRGRGCLEINPSPNPFFQTTSSDIGVNTNKHIDWRVSGRAPPVQQRTRIVDGNFAFLYTRESDEIGGKVNKPQMDRPKLLTTTEFMKKKREAQLAAGNVATVEEVMTHTTREKAEALLNAYEHDAKYEDPRYVTANVSNRYMLLIYALNIISKCNFLLLCISIDNAGCIWS
jgi:hypothetical protein